MEKIDFKKIALVVISLALLVFIFIQFYTLASVTVSTQTANSYTYSQTITTTGFVLRNETQEFTVNNKNYGYNIDNGEKVSKNSVIANVYSNPNDILSQNKIKELSSDIDVISKILSIKSNDVELSSVNKNIASALCLTLSAMQNSDVDSQTQKEDDFIFLSSQKQVTIGLSDPFETRLTELKAELLSLKQNMATPTDRVLATKAGYFVKSTDGLENEYDYTKAEDISLVQLQDLQAKTPSIDYNTTKIVTSPIWYIACEIPNNNVLDMKVGKNYNLKIPLMSTSLISMKLESVNQQDRSQNAVAVFSCDLIDEKILSLRNVDVEIVVETYTGLKIDTSAIELETMEVNVYDENGKKTGTKEVELTGVYILFGDEVRFREIKILKNTNDFTICSTSTTGLSYPGLKLYDNVVVSGKDLYNGKEV